MPILRYEIAPSCLQSDEDMIGQAHNNVSNVLVACFAVLCSAAWVASVADNQGMALCVTAAVTELPEAFLGGDDWSERAEMAQRISLPNVLPKLSQQAESAKC